MPPIPEILGGSNGWLFWVCALVLIGGVLWKPARMLGKVVKSVAAFAEDWNGTPDRTDHTGAIIEKGRPGVPAILERVRAQVENSHGTVLRDDLDRSEAKLDDLSRKLDEHITYAITSDRKLAKVEEAVEELKKHHEGQ